MVKAKIKVYRTLDGKYIGQVRRFELNRTVTHYETAEYITRSMADADAKCWEAFHMTVACNLCTQPKHVGPCEWMGPDKEMEPKAPEYTICDDDVVRTVKMRNGVPQAVWTSAQFAKKLTLWTNLHPKITYRVGTTDDRGCVAKGGDFFLAVNYNEYPNSRDRWFIVKKDYMIPEFDNPEDVLYT